MEWGGGVGYGDGEGVKGREVFGEVGGYGD